MYLPQRAFPLAASYVVIPLEQEYRNMQMAQKLRIMTIFLMVYVLRYRDQFKGKKL
jgi:hypothetical protein